MAGGITQTEYWNGEVGTRWARNQAVLDAMFVPLTEALFAPLALRAGASVLDIGCGAGRHSLEAVRRGAHTIALDLSHRDLCRARDSVAEYGHVEVPAPGSFLAVQGDARHIPFADACFDRVIASEVLEHIVEDEAAIAELVRVLRPGGVLAVTVPRWMPERVCWALSREYHDVAGGHVRIYRGAELRAKLRRAGLRDAGAHHAHALHSPYWWLRCAFGPDRDDPLPVRLYHRLLVWDMFRRPAVTRRLEAALNPVLGKSLVLYGRKPAVAATLAGEQRDDAA
jgi:SAM-dependent methyltransferase